MGYNETPMKGPQMFKDRAVEVRVVKTNKTNKTDKSNDVVQNSTLDPEKLAELAQDVALNSALAVGSVIVVVKVVSTVCDIAKLIVKANLK